MKMDAGCFRKTLITVAAVVSATAAASTLGIFLARHLSVASAMRSQETFHQITMADVISKDISINPFEGYRIKVQGKVIEQAIVSASFQQFTQARKGQKLCISYDLYPIVSGKPTPYKVENARVCSEADQHVTAAENNIARLERCPLVSGPAPAINKAPANFQYDKKLDDAADDLAYRLHVTSSRR